MVLLAAQVAVVEEHLQPLVQVVQVIRQTPPQAKVITVVTVLLIHQALMVLEVVVAEQVQ
jgi:hypothetical protein